MEQIVYLSEESQYNEILRQAVAVIEANRSKAASAIIGAAHKKSWIVPIRPMCCLSTYAIAISIIAVEHK